MCIHSSLSLSCANIRGEGALASSHNGRKNRKCLITTDGSGTNYGLSLGFKHCQCRVLGKVFIYLYIYTNTYTHICTQDTLNKVRAVHIMIDSVSQSCGPCQPSEVVLAANASKKKKRQDYESCIELLRNVNNAKSKPVHYTD